MTRTRRQCTGAILLSLGMVVAEARAEEESLLGSRVRVRTVQLRQPQVGVLAEATGDELVLETSATGSRIKLRRGEVATLEVSRGRHRHTLQGLLGGAVAWGAVVGLVAAFDTLDESGVGEPLFIGGMLALGAGVGSLVKTERWEPVSSDRVSIWIAPAPGGVRAGIAVGF